jgi:hypothetical protein
VDAAIGPDGFTRVRALGAVGFTALAAWLVCESLLGDRWVPILDHANLALHEAGHPLCFLIHERLGVYGGTLFQLLFPLAAALHFARRRETLSLAVTGAWCCESLLNVSYYLADARAMALPLLGGLEPETSHDWRLILGRWGLLEWDRRLAGLLATAAVLGIVALMVEVWRRYLRDRGRAQRLTGARR